MADTDRRHDDDVLDERAIREDERAQMEHDLRTLDDDRDDRDVVHRDDRVEEVEVVRMRSFSFGQLLTILVGAALVAYGVVALITTGLDTPLNQPVEEVMGYAHTPWLGILEVASGALLILFSLRPGGRWLVALVGLALIVGGIMIAAELDWTVEELGAESGYAWIPIVAGGVAVLAALLTPRRYQRMTGIPADRLP